VVVVVVVLTVSGNGVVEGSVEVGNKFDIALKHFISKGFILMNNR
jgi:hypothetical protein